MRFGRYLPILLLASCSPAPAQDTPPPSEEEEMGSHAPSLDDSGQPDEPDEAGEDGGDDGVVFANINDTPNLPDPCDIYGQDCPSGEKCTMYAPDFGPWDFEYTKCVPVVPNPMAAGQPCRVVDNVFSGIDDCDATTRCWDVMEDGRGTCLPFCIGNPDDPSCIEGYSCLFWKAGFGLCFPPCDPTVQDCPVGCGCYPSNIEEQFACGPAGKETLDADCQFGAQCEAGLTCVNLDGCDTESGNCCRPFCIVGTDECDCTPWFVDIDEGPYAHIGVCLP